MEMTDQPAPTFSPETAVHRLGGRAVANLRLKPAEEKLSPVGFSVLLGGTPEQAAEQVRRAYPQAKRLLQAAKIVGRTTGAAVRGAGFDVLAVPSSHFPNHARIVHPEGLAGFSDVHLEELSRTFQDVAVQGAS